jgi:hypothetical protein
MTAIVPHSADDLHAFVAERFLPGLKKLLEHSGPRQRLRVTAVPTPVMHPCPAVASFRHQAHRASKRA